MSDVNSQSNNDELESARILIQENLYDEAKRVLFRLLTRINDPMSFSHRRAKELLSKIEAIELNEIMTKVSRSKTIKNVEDSTLIISRLEKELDLDLDSYEENTPLMESEFWNVNLVPTTVVGLFDLAIAFYEMGCFGDALRELRRAEKKIRIEESFLGEVGVSIVALYAQTLLKIGHPFRAKIYLEPILLESDLLHEQKIILYYTMGIIEQALEEKSNAKGWFKKVAASDPEFKDVQQRLRLLAKIT